MDKQTRPENIPKRSTYYYTARYAVVGTAFGLLFPLVGTFIVLTSFELGANLAGVFKAQLGEPLLWIIDTAPLFLGLFAALAGRREDRLRLIASKLLETVDSLEERVAERTDDLKQAVEIGHQVTRVVDLEEMLSRSVEMIRTRYDLDDVELYLADQSGSSLTLRARSSPEAPSTALHGRRIPLGFESLIGTAAIERELTTAGGTITPTSPQDSHADFYYEMAVPLLVGERVVGVLDLQSSKTSRLSSEIVPALEAIAGQLAIAIENARLIGQAQEAQAEVQEQARRLARAGWQEFLNAIDRKEHLGFAYEREQIAELQADSHVQPGPNILVPITISGETVGQIEVQVGDDQESELELVEAVAQQVGQQVENLRLLAEADRYRDEAEKATRRLTREGWDAYLQSREDSMSGYAYHLSQVSALPSVPDEGSNDLLLSRDLVVRGESIGKIEVAEGGDSDEEVNELVTAVAEQLSAHLESLRLTEQTEEALSETELLARRLAALNELGQALAGAATIDEVYRIAAARTSQIIPADRTSIAILSDSGDTFELLSLHGRQGVTKVGEGVSVEGSALGVAVREGRVVLVNETAASGIPGVESFIVAPLKAGGRTLGALNAGANKRNAYSQQDVRLLVQIASLLASAIDSRTLFAQTQRRAEELAVLNEMGRALTSEMQVESVVQSVVEHASRLVSAKSFSFVLYDENRKAIEVRELGQTQPSVHDLASEPLIEYVIANNQSLLIQEDTEGRLSELEIDVEDEGSVASAWLGVPVIAGGEVAGALVAQHYDHDQNFGAHQRDLLEAVASQAGIALENARLFGQVQSRARRERILRQVTARVRGTTDVDSIMRTAAKEVGQALGRQSFVFLGNGGANVDDQSEEQVEED